MMRPGATRLSFAGAALAAVLAVCAGARAADAPLEIAQRQFDAGKYPAAISFLQAAAARSPEQAQVYYWLGRCYYELGDYANAIPPAERAVKLDPQNSELHLWLGRAYGRQADRVRGLTGLSLARKTKREFEEAVRLDPRNIPARRDLMQYYADAPWIAGGSKEKAQEQVAAVAALDAVEGALARADYWKELKKFDLVEPEYLRVMEWKPKRVDPYLEVANFYASRGDTARMEAAVEAAARVNPYDLRLPFYRGVVRVLGGNHWADAEAYLKSYLASAPQRSDLPSHAEARTWLGQLYERQGKRMEAAEQYRAALQLDPKQEYARASLKHLEKQSH